MVVGAAQVELHVHGARSLKEKRGAVRSILRRVRNRFNVSALEVGGQGTWQRAVLGLAIVGHDGGSAHALLEKIVAFVDDLHLAEVVGSEIEVIGGDETSLGALEDAGLLDRGEDAEEPR